MSDIGIVIVTYNSGLEIGECLEAALASGAEVLVVDNASTDGTIAEVARSGARWIANESNRGFAAAVNQGIAAMECSYVLLLNPDAMLIRGLDALREACDLPGAAGAGGCLLDRAGNPQVGFMVRGLPTPAVLILEALLLNRVCPNNSVNRRYRGLRLDYGKRIPVEQPAGAFLMLRRSVWQELGGLDEGFWPVWFEDVDYCCRAIDKNYHLFYVPEAVAKHTGGHSISRISLEMRRYYWYRSLLRYAAIHFRPVGFRMVSLAVLAGSVLRIVAESASDGSLKPLAVYGKVVRLAGRCLVFGRREGAVWSRSPV